MTMPAFKIKSTGLVMTNTIAAYLEKKIAQISKLIPEHETALSLSVELEKMSAHHKAGKIYRAEINLKMGKSLFRAEAEAETIEAAIDDVKDELKTELTKTASKQKTQKRTGARAAKRMLRE